MKRFQKILIAAAFLLAISGAFASKTNRKALTQDIYGEVSGTCEALCATTGSSSCTKSSSDGWYLSQTDCTNQTNPYSGNRFELP